VLHRCGECEDETLALGLTQGQCVGEAFLGLQAQGGDGFPQGQELLFGLTYQCYEDAPLPSTAAATAPHDFCEGVFQVLGLAMELGGPAAALLRDVVDELERFF
jgi:hypothetical protein